MTQLKSEDFLVEIYGSSEIRRLQFDVADAGDTSGFILSLPGFGGYEYCVVIACGIGENGEPGRRMSFLDRTDRGLRDRVRALRW